MTTEALVPAAAAPAIATGGAGEIVLPQVIVDAGPSAVARFLEFFAGRIANARTRAAYGRAVGQFLGWCEARGLRAARRLPAPRGHLHPDPPRVGPTVKQHLAEIRMLGDWLVVSQVLSVNPAAAVRGPKHVVTKGATPVLSPAEARKLLESSDTGAMAGLRDRALLSVMLYSFARVSAVLGMRRQDDFGQGRRGWLRLHEKGGEAARRPGSPPGRGCPRRLRRGQARGAEGGRPPRSRRGTPGSRPPTPTPRPWARPRRPSTPADGAAAALPGAPSPLDRSRLQPGGRVPPLSPWNPVESADGESADRHRCDRGGLPTEFYPSHTLTLCACPKGSRSASPPKSRPASTCWCLQTWLRNSRLPCNGRLKVTE